MTLPAKTTVHSKAWIVSRSTLFKLVLISLILLMGIASYELKERKGRLEKQFAQMHTLAEAYWNYALKDPDMVPENRIPTLDQLVADGSLSEMQASELRKSFSEIIFVPFSAKDEDHQPILKLRSSDGLWVLRKGGDTSLLRRDEEKTKGLGGGISI